MISLATTLAEDRGGSGSVPEQAPSDGAPGGGSVLEGSNSQGARRGVQEGQEGAGAKEASGECCSLVEHVLLVL